jgi:hypothetical protein
MTFSYPCGRKTAEIAMDSFVDDIETWSYLGKISDDEQAQMMESYFNEFQAALINTPKNRDKIENISKKIRKEDILNPRPLKQFKK